MDEPLIPTDANQVDQYIAKVRRCLELYIDTIYKTKRLYELQDKGPRQTVVMHDKKGQPRLRDLSGARAARYHRALVLRQSREISVLEQELFVLIREAVAATNGTIVDAVTPLVEQPRAFAVALRLDIESLTNLVLWAWNDPSGSVTEATRLKAAQKVSNRLTLIETDRLVGSSSGSKPLKARESDPSLERLRWLLDKMMDALRTVPAEVALGTIGPWEDEAAELIESTGLAEEREVPRELLPVFRRVAVDFDEHGFPDAIRYSFATVDCRFSMHTFDPWYASADQSLQATDKKHGRVIWQRPVPMDRIPDAEFVADLLRCVKGWRDYTDAPRRPVDISKKGIIDPLLNAVGRHARHFRDALDTANHNCLPNFPPNERSQIAGAQLEVSAKAMQAVLESVPTDPTWPVEVQLVVSKLREAVVGIGRDTYRDLCARVGTAVKVLIRNGVVVANPIEGVGPERAVEPAVAPKEVTELPEWSTYMPKNVLADCLDCDQRDLNKLHGPIIEFKSRQRWRVQLDKCDVASVKRYESWRSKERPKKKPRGKSANPGKLAQTPAE